MDDAHLGRLRGFALVVGLLLITYESAGIIVEPHITAFGLSFRVSRPNLFPIGLAIASLCSALRFYYYGLTLGTSPHRRRRDLIDGLMVHFDEYEYARPGGPTKYHSGKQVPMYWGSRKFSAKAWQYDRQIVEKLAAAFENAFPKFAGARASAKLVHFVSYDENGDEYTTYNVDIIVPLRCRVWALFEDIDYTAPVWLNAFALMFFVWSLTKGIIPLRI